MVEIKAAAKDHQKLHNSKFLVQNSAVLFSHSYDKFVDPISANFINPLAL